MLTRNRPRKLPRLPRTLANLIIHDLRNAYPTARFCTHFNTGERVIPEELWFPMMQVWMRTSDMTINGDSSHHFERWRCGWLTRRRVAAALDFYRRAERWA